jgi:F0F1-type ATP synthase membrane subunit c/vacuolar-type H+-ATPase subunit K
VLKDGASHLFHRRGKKVSGTMFSGMFLHDALVVISLAVLAILFVSPFIAPCERR